MKMRYQCLVLDHDDTVVRSTPEIHHPAFIEAMKALRPERAGMSMEDFLSCSNDPGILAFLQDVLRLDERELAIEQDIWRKYTRNKIAPPYEGFCGLLRAFRGRGGRVCVVSHSEAANIARDYRAHFGFEPDMIFGWERPEAERKPHPFPLDEIMRVLRLAPSELLMVDDLLPGLIMAQARDVDFAWAGWSDTGPVVGQPVRERAKYTPQSVSELSKIVFSGEDHTVSRSTT